MNKRKISKSTQHDIELAIKQVEQFITDLEPKTYNEIKIATTNISKAALGAYLSVHTVNEALEFINNIAHSMVEDISEHIIIPKEDANKIH